MSVGTVSFGDEDVISTFAFDVIIPATSEDDIIATDYVGLELIGVVTLREVGV